MSEWEIIEENEWEPVDQVSAPTKGWKGVGQDLLSLVKNSPEMLEQFAQNVIEGTPRQISGVAQHPERIPQGLFAGLLGVPHGIASIPRGIGNYLAEKEIISPESAATINTPPYSPQELAGLKEEMPGDTLTGLLGGLASGGPIGPAAIKGAGKGLSAASKGLKNAAEKGTQKISEGQLGQIYRGISNTRTGEVLKEGYKKDLEKSTQLYADAFGSANEKGVKQIPHNISPKDIDFIKDYLPDTYIDKLEKAMNEGSLENFHGAQSDLLKFSRMIEKRARTNPEISSTVKEAGKQARKMSQKIQGAISKELLNKGGMDLWFKYMGAGDNYAKNVVPWFDLPSIKGAVKNPGEPGFRYPSHLPGETGVKKGDPFLSGKGQEFPELLLNRKLASPYGKLLEILLGTGAFGKFIQQ